MGISGAVLAKISGGIPVGTFGEISEKKGPEQFLWESLGEFLQVCLGIFVGNPEEISEGIPKGTLGGISQKIFLRKFWWNTCERSFGGIFAGTPTEIT